MSLEHQARCTYIRTLLGFQCQQLKSPSISLFGTVNVYMCCLHVVTCASRLKCVCTIGAHVRTHPKLDQQTNHHPKSTDTRICDPLYTCQSYWLKHKLVHTCAPAKKMAASTRQSGTEESGKWKMTIIDIMCIAGTFSVHGKGSPTS